MTDNPPKQSKFGLYSPSEVSEILRLPDSTLRRYAQNYAHLLSDTANRKGRRRSYTPADLNILKQIRDLTAQHRSKTEIESLLQVVREPEQQQPIDEDLRLAPYIAGQFEQLAASIAQMQSSQAEQLDQLRSEIDQLRKELAEQRRPFWQKIRRKSD